MGLRTAAVVLVATALTVGSLIWASNVAKAEVERRALAGLVGIGRATVLQERHAWDDALRIVDAGASRPALLESLRSGDSQTAVEIAENVLIAGPFAAIRVYDASGGLLASALLPGVTPTEFGSVPDAARTVGPPVTSEGQTTRQVTVALLQTGGPPLGRLVADVDLTQLLGKPSDLAFGNTGTKFLVTPDATIAAGSTSVGTKLLSEVNRGMVAGGKAATRTIYSPFFERMTVESFEPIPGQGLGILVQQAQSEIMAGADRIAAVLRWAALLTALIGAAVAASLGSFLSRRSRRIAAQEQQFLEESKRAESKFQALLESAPDAIVVVGSNGLIRLVNRQTEVLFGYSRSELIGEPVEMLIPERLAGNHPGLRTGYSAAPSVRAMGAGLELAARRKDGSEFPVDISLSPLETEEGVLISAAVRDVTERKLAEMALKEREEQLAAARDQALEASRLKSQFLANMSHEIRTPMNGVLGMAQLILAGELNTEQRRRVLSLQQSGESLLTIINDILDFSKMEAGKMELEAEDFNLLLAADGVLSLLSAQAYEKGLELKFRVDPEVPEWVTGDSVRLRQILLNLVGNAVKFTEKGQVEFSVAPAGEKLRFSVRDTGIGIDPTQRERLLAPFSQGDASTTRRFGGTGLGLAICRQLVELMGGELEFTSEAGTGATFWFDVALPRADAPAAADRREEARMVPTPQPAGADAPRILLVDDVGINREVGIGLLSSLGYVADTASSGAQAIEAISGGGYAAILMDCLMPEMDGYEATRRIRALDSTVKDTPIIALTAAAMKGDRERCLAAGMDDYVSKPLEVKMLTAALNRQLSRRQDARGPRKGAAPGPSLDGTPQADDSLPATLDQFRKRFSAQAFTRICEEFLATTPEMISQLGAAVRDGESETAMALAHKLKGSTATLGATRLSKLAQQLQESQRDGGAGAEELVARIGAEYGVAERVVSSRLASSREA